MLKAFRNLAGGIASAAGGSLLPARQGFASTLHAAEAERHRTILVREEAIPRNPPGWSIDDLSPGAHGFVPLREAARRMALSEQETLDLCVRSHLEAYREGSVLYVRPAIVSVLGARATPTPRAARLP